MNTFIEHKHFVHRKSQNQRAEQWIFEYFWARLSTINLNFLGLVTHMELYLLISIFFFINTNLTRWPAGIKFAANSTRKIQTWKILQNIQTKQQEKNASVDIIKLRASLSSTVGDNKLTRNRYSTNNCSGNRRRSLL